MQWQRLQSLESHNLKHNTDVTHAEATWVVKLLKMSDARDTLPSKLLTTFEGHLGEVAVALRALHKVGDEFLMPALRMKASILLSEVGCNPDGRWKVMAEQGLTPALRPVARWGPFARCHYCSLWTRLQQASQASTH